MVLKRSLVDWIGNHIHKIPKKILKNTFFLNTDFIYLKNTLLYQQVFSNTAPFIGLSHYLAMVRIDTDVYLWLSDAQFELIMIMARLLLSLFNSSLRWANNKGELLNSVWAAWKLLNYLCGARSGWKLNRNQVAEYSRSAFVSWRFSFLIITGNHK